MRLGEQDRAALFGTLIPSQQLQRYLFKRPNHSASMQEVRDIFSDLSKGAFYSLLFSSKSEGYIRLEGDSILLNVDRSSFYSTTRDVVWRDIRILKVFTIEQVMNDTGLGYQSVKSAIMDFCNEGYLSRSRKIATKPTVYTLLADIPVRPQSVRKRKTQNAIYRVLDAARSYGDQPFTVGRIQKKLEKTGRPVSQHHCRNILFMWAKSGIIRKLPGGRTAAGTQYVWVGEQEPESATGKEEEE